MTKRIALFTLLLLQVAAGSALACDVCQENQPKGLENITHGPGPSGSWDYFIMYGAGIIVAITLFYSVKYLVRPKENDPNHAKNIILKQGF